MTARAQTGILISGRGSNMRALIAAACAPGFAAEIALVLSDRVDAAGLEAAREMGIAAEALDFRTYSGKAEFESALDQRLRAARVDLICLAGFMRMLTAEFTAAWRGRMINIHPALLPAFRGLDTHARALAAGATTHGATVHFVVPEMDAGPIIAQAAVPVLAGDTPETLAARVLRVEHEIYPAALRALAEGQVAIDTIKKPPG